MSRSLPLLDYDNDDVLHPVPMCRSSMRLSRMLRVHTAVTETLNGSDKSKYTVKIDAIKEHFSEILNESIQSDVDQCTVLNDGFLQF